MASLLPGHAQELWQHNLTSSAVSRTSLSTATPFFTLILLPPSTATWAERPEPSVARALLLTDTCQGCNTTVTDPMRQG